jgi:hypothetical protein
LELYILGPIYDAIVKVRYVYYFYDEYKGVYPNIQFSLENYENAQYTVIIDFSEYTVDMILQF